MKLSRAERRVIAEEKRKTIESEIRAFVKASVAFQKILGAEIKTALREITIGLNIFMTNKIKKSKEPHLWREVWRKMEAEAGKAIEKMEEK